MSPVRIYSALINADLVRRLRSHLQQLAKYQKNASIVTKPYCVDIPCSSRRPLLVNWTPPSAIKVFGLPIELIILLAQVFDVFVAWSLRVSPLPAKAEFRG